MAKSAGRWIAITTWKFDRRETEPQVILDITARSEKPAVATIAEIISPNDRFALMRFAARLPRKHQTP